MLQAIAAYLLSPLSLALGAGLVAIALALLRHRRAAVVVAATGFGLLWICSTPRLADALVAHLENEYPPTAPAAAPAADAIVVLGGALSGARPPHRPTIMLSQSSTRVWHAAALYRAGKARWVVVAAGNRPNHAMEQVEADAITELLVQLGVPRTAIVPERASQTTRENAVNSLPIVRKLGAKRVLLVTSGIHMPRAMKTFVGVWGSDGPQLVASETDLRGQPNYLSPAEAWLPSLDALINVNRSLKEFAGLLVLAIIL